MKPLIDYEKYFDKINKNNFKLVCLQFPDGLKPKSNEILKNFEENCKNTIFFIYLGSCFGACDYPFELKEYNFDYIIQFGHNEFIR
ncbi:MAG: diphthamide synthesis protein [Candidatus Nanoarchaeia archaeon]|nr:diphthamide synthesis protein [Candidatus Nanoarchaeia archaeon]